MTPQYEKDVPIRAGVFNNSQAVDGVIMELTKNGFRRDQITVVCNAESQKRHFAEFEHQQSAGTFTPGATVVGGTLGATLVGISAVVAGAIFGGIPLIVFAGAGAATGGMVGSFIGAMMTRGFEQEAANFYNQAVLSGKILVTVEDTSPEQEQKLAIASRIIMAAGALPMELPVG
jgi:hypothetical protein